MNNENISVKDIAEMAGTSVATVSRVINQNGRFSKETEKRVQDIIRKYNYQPNQLARSLRVRHTRVVGILVPDITNSFFASIIREVQEALMEEGYMTLICNTNESNEQANRQVQMLLAQKVSGIIYIGEAEITDTLEVPTVYIDRDPRNTKPELKDDFELIECDNIQGGYLAGRELIGKGAKKITFVRFDIGLSTDKKRLQGFQKALEEAGMEFNPDAGVLVREASMTEGARAAEYILKCMPDVDGIFFLSDMLAIGGLNYLSAQGVQIPAQMRLIGFDDIGLCEAVRPALTTIHQPTDVIGRLAAKRILAMIGGKKIKLKRQRIPVELVVRGTT